MLLLRTIPIYCVVSLLRIEFNKHLLKLCALKELTVMQTLFMAIEQEAIAWLLSLAFDYSAWNRYRNLAPWTQR